MSWWDVSKPMQSEDKKIVFLISAVTFSEEGIFIISRLNKEIQ